MRRRAIFISDFLLYGILSKIPGERSNLRPLWLEINFHKDFQGIIEGDQIQVAAFSLEYFSYLTGQISYHPGPMRTQALRAPKQAD